MSTINVNAIDKESGSTLTLGGSGTAVTLHASATASGFGLESVQTFTSSGTWTRPTGITKVIIEVQGAGGGGGGPGYFAGPTGGYLIGYLLGAGAAGLISRIGKKETVWVPLGVVVGFAAVYITGVPWLKYILNLSWGKACIVGLTPFILGDAIKAGVVIAITITLYKTVQELLPSRKV